MRLGIDPGTRFKDFPLRPIPVSSLIRAMARQAGAAGAGDEDESAGETMSRLYSLLSDHTHPNHSAQHLSSRIDDKWMIDWGNSTMGGTRGPSTT